MHLPEKLFISTKKDLDSSDSIDSLLEDRFSDTDKESISAAIENKLPIDLIETEHTYIVMAPVPAIPVKNIAITLDSDTLTITGKTHQATFVKGSTVYRECQWGMFSRTITLPKNIKRTGHKANVKDGVLTVILPKTKNKNPKQIPVESYDE